MKNCKIAIIGLGYIGLPLAIEFARANDVLGFDIDNNRVTELSRGIDRTREADLDALKSVVELRKTKSNSGLTFSSEETDLKGYNVFIITVPTPVDHANRPDLRFLLDASEMVGRFISKGDIVIYESTTYPGCTEEVCVPVIERASGLIFNTDFFVGYSPERISPGDRVNTLTSIKKVTSGSTPEIADWVDALYGSIIKAGTYKAPSIKVAEASKVIENAQRDVNISFVNEIALICDRMGIDTQDVLDAAGTKWNFLNYRPGLVGGHCISVDPYYLASKAESLGYVPRVILSGRRVNNEIAPFIASKLVKLMIAKGHKIKGAKVLILGITFKENCPDIRNSKVIDIYKELTEFGLDVDVYDPCALPEEVMRDYDISLLPGIDDETKYEGVILAVAHSQFREIDFQRIYEAGAVIYDAKAVVDRRWVDSRL